MGLKLRICDRFAAIFNVELLAVLTMTCSYMGHSMSDHPMLETVPPQILIKVYTFGVCD